MKALYSDPEMDVIRFSAEDVIVTSTGTGEGNGNIDGGNDDYVGPLV